MPTNTVRSQTRQKREFERSKKLRALKKRKLDLEKEELQLKRRELEFEEEEFASETTDNQVEVAKDEDQVTFVSEKKVDKRMKVVAGSTKEKAENDAAVDPDSALAKIQVLAAKFRTEWLPQCKAFITFPPTNARIRGAECQKLSLSLEEHFILKADEIEVQGDAKAKRSRKKLVDEVEEIMKNMEGTGGRTLNKQIG